MGGACVLDLLYIYFLSVLKPETWITGDCSWAESLVTILLLQMQNVFFFFVFYVFVSFCVHESRQTILKTSI